MEESEFLALPEDQRKAVQRQLQEQGLYQGPIDGKSGPGTRAALQARKRLQETQAQQQSQAQLRRQELELEQQRLREQAAQREAQQQQQQQAIEQQQAREESADPLMEQFAPFGAGFVGGAAYGELANRGLNKFETGNVEALKEISDELGPTRDLTSSQLNRSRATGAARAAERFAPTGVNRLMNVTGRALSYGIPAAAVYNEYLNYQQRADEAPTETERIANQQIANSLLGGSTGIAVEGGRRFFFPSRSPGLGEAQMRIETARDFANRMDANDARPPAPQTPRPAPEPAQPAAQQQARPVLPGSRPDLMQQARRYGIKGRSKMTTDQLREAVGDAVKRTPAPRGRAAAKMLRSPALLPLVAGTTAGAAAYNDAQARGSAPITGSSAGDAAVTGGATAGVAGAGAYGVNKLLQAVPALGRAVVGGAAMSLPGEIADATTQTPEQLAMARNKAARYLPEFMQVGPVGEAAEMAQVPERGERGLIGRRDMNAANLEIPQDIPTEPDPGMDGEEPMDFDQYLADLQMIMREIGQDQRPAPRRPGPVAPSAPQNRLMTAY